MDFLTNAIAFFWLVRTIKFVLFWIYLWQLKEYHIGRFIDHYRTHQGKKLIFNLIFLIKILLLPVLFIRPGFAWVLLLVYILESSIFILHIIKGNFKRPIITLKTILLMSAG